jgi:predicted transposase YbfD/YdcC
MVGLGLLFAAVEDPRAANARHDLSEILFIAFAAVLCGGESCVDMAAFGASKADLLASVLALEHGVPSHDTFSRLFSLLDPEQFEVAFRGFMTRFAASISGQIGTAGQVIALDGKSLRGAVDAAKRTQPLHLVTAWAAEQRLVLGLKRAPERSEVTAAREIIAMLDLTATTVTADALHGNRETAAAIRERGGDYALALKGNRGALHDEAQALLANADPEKAAITIEKSHGRHEERCAWVREVPKEWPEQYGFKDLAAVARIDALRRINGEETRQTRYYVLSRVLDTAEALRVVRAHWSIENNQHWLLDVALAEDRAHTRNDRTAENIALLRRLALNLLRADPAKGSIRLKVKRAGWQDDYLLSLLRQMR